MSRIPSTTASWTLRCWINEEEGLAIVAIGDLRAPSLADSLWHIVYYIEFSRLVKLPSMVLDKPRNLVHNDVNCRRRDWRTWRGIRNVLSHFMTRR